MAFSYYKGEWRCARGGGKRRERREAPREVEGLVGRNIEIKSSVGEKGRACVSMAPKRLMNVHQ